VEALLPEGAIPLEPTVELGERFRPKPVDPPLRPLLDLDEPCLTQDAQVPGHTRPGDRERRGKLARRGRVGAQDLEHRAPAFVGERVQHRVHDSNVPGQLRTRQVTYTDLGEVAPTLGS